MTGFAQYERIPVKRGLPEINVAAIPTGCQALIVVGDTIRYPKMMAKRISKRDRICVQWKSVVICKSEEYGIVISFQKGSIFMKFKGSYRNVLFVIAAMVFAICITSRSSEGASNQAGKTSVSLSAGREARWLPK